jgi:hypothetical protein
MKLVLLLICLIAVANSAEILTSATATLWTLTYLAPAATTTAYNFTIAFSTGATISADVITTNAEEIGVICIITTSNFTIVDTASASTGWSMGSAATRANALNSAAGNWGPLTLQTHPAMTHSSDSSIITGATTANCALVTVANIPAYAAFVHTYSNSALSACANLSA